MRSASKHSPKTGCSPVVKGKNSASVSKAASSASPDVSIGGMEDEAVGSSQQSSVSLNEDVATASFSLHSDLDLESDEDTLPADNTVSPSTADHTAGSGRDYSGGNSGHHSAYSSDTDIEMDNDEVSKESESVRTSILTCKSNHEKTERSKMGPKGTASNRSKDATALLESTATADSVADVHTSAIFAAETSAAAELLAPVSKPYSGCPPWICPDCNTTNEGDDEDCDGCFKPRPEFTTHRHDKNTG